MNLPYVFWLQKNYPNIKVNKLKEYEAFKKPYICILLGRQGIDGLITSC